MIPVERAHLQVAATTHAGMKGKNNEDRYAISAHRVSEKDPTPSLLAIVTDGVGGHRAGEVAAEIAVEVISRVVTAGEASQPLQALQEAFQQANQTIYSQSLVDPDLLGMSTTCVCAWVLGERLYIASVGDSRIYLLHEAAIYQLTMDHTWVQEALEAGALTPEQARHHPNAHIIRRHLGSQAPAVPDFRLRLRPNESDAQSLANQGYRLQPGDRLVLCSDGLTDLVAAEEIRSMMAGRDLEQATRELVDLANARGGHDNITILGIEIPGAKRAASNSSRLRRRTLLAWWLWALIALIFLGGILGGGYVWFQTHPPAKPTTTPTMLALDQPVIVLTLTRAPDNTPTPALVAEATVTATAGKALPPSQSPLPQATYTPWPTSTP